MIYDCDQVYLHINMDMNWYDIWFVTKVTSTSIWIWIDMIYDLWPRLPPHQYGYEMIWYMIVTKVTSPSIWIWIDMIYDCDQGYLHINMDMNWYDIWLWPRLPPHQYGYELIWYMIVTKVTSTSIWIWIDMIYDCDQGYLHINMDMNWYDIWLWPRLPPHQYGYELIWYMIVTKVTSTSHYNNVIMGAIASQITSLTIVYTSVYSDADQREHQSSASLAFVRGIRRGQANSPHKWPVMRKMFPFDDVIMQSSPILWYNAHFPIQIL